MKPTYPAPIPNDGREVYVITYDEFSQVADLFKRDIAASVDKVFCIHGDAMRARFAQQMNVALDSVGLVKSEGPDGNLNRTFYYWCDLIPEGGKTK